MPLLLSFVRAEYPSLRVSQNMKILLADDHELFNEGFTLLLHQLFQGCTVEHANSWPVAKKFIQQAHFDLSVLDLFMPAQNSWQNELAEVIGIGNAGAVCVLTSSLNQDHMNQAFALGVKGYIHKSSNFADIRTALRLTLDGKTYLPPQLINGSKADTSLGSYRSKLTSRQHKILTLIAEGKENRRIAAELGIKESTVKRHVYNIFKQLGAGNRTEAVHIARQLGLLADS